MARSDPELNAVLRIENALDTLKTYAVRRRVLDFVSSRLDDSEFGPSLGLFDPRKEGQAPPDEDTAEIPVRTSEPGGR